MPRGEERIGDVLTERPVNLQKVRAAMARFCDKSDEEAHAELDDAWKRARITAADPARSEFIKATLLLLDAVLGLSPAVRLVVAMGLAEPARAEEDYPLWGRD